jgi:hypothetical protein
VTAAADMSWLDTARAIKAAQAPRVDLLKGMAESFPEAYAYITDKAPLKAAFCTRRAAKSYSVGLEFMQDSFAFPGAHYLLLMTSRPQAERDFWNDVLKAIDKKHSLGCKFNESKLICTMQNGARIYVGGADASENEWRKLVAGKYRKVQIDEAQGFIHADLHNLVFETFKPAVMDYRGSVGLSGTPGIVARGLFYEVTQKNAPGWSRHSWTTENNPHMREQFRAEIAELKANHPGIEKTPSFRRNYLKQWVTDDTGKVYKYAEPRNDYAALPEFKRGAWHYVIGCDLGYNDPTAWVVCAWHDYDSTLYLLETRSEPGLDITAAANITRKLTQRYDVEALVIDGANKQAVEEMRKRHNLPWRAADKTGKSDFIELMNDEFIMGKIKLSPLCDALRTEYADLVWDPRIAKAEKEGKKVPTREEHPALPNHCADAALYAWRYCYAFLSEKPAAPPAAGTPEFEDALEQEDEEREAEKRREQEEIESWM